jgi:cell division protein FtsL
MFFSVQLYFVFGFLFVVLVILVVTCAEITIVMCYFQVRDFGCFVVYIPLLRPL